MCLVEVQAQLLRRDLETEPAIPLMVCCSNCYTLDITNSDNSVQLLRRPEVLIVCERTNY